MRNQVYRAPNARGRGDLSAADCARDTLPVLALLPTQQLGAVFEPECGFYKGTVFPELYKPLGKAGCQG